jgi:hypothetical protein
VHGRESVEARIEARVAGGRFTRRVAGDAADFSCGSVVAVSLDVTGVVVDADPARADEGDEAGVGVFADVAVVPGTDIGDRAVFPEVVLFAFFVRFAVEDLLVGVEVETA